MPDPNARRPVWIAAALLAAGCATPPSTQTVTPAPVDEITSPALQPPTGRFLKRKVSIERFSNETLYGKSPLLGVDVLGKQASDILSSRLAQTRKFVLFDAEAAEGAAARADYRIVGSVSEFGRATTGETGVFSKTKTQTAYAAVNLRIVSARTGLVVFSAEGRGEAELTTGKVLGVGTAQGFDSSLSEKAISTAISKVISDLVEKLLDEPWTSQVLAVDAEGCIIAGGAAQGIAAGDRFVVLQRGERVENPQTGVPIELPGRQVAELEVVSTFGEDPLAEGARCRLVGGSLEGLALDQLQVTEGSKATDGASGGAR